MSGSLDVSVIVCTRDRSSDLAEAVESLLNQQDVADLQWEILVVDNGSSDDTRAVTAGVAEGAGVPVRYFLEEEPGLSHARNRGIRESSGKILAFIDDDAVAEPDWLAEVLPAFAEPGVVSAGGKILPRMEEARPDWMDDEWLDRMGFSYDFGPKPRSVRILLGSNMAFRREVLERFGGFDTRLGRSRGCLLGGEENLLFSSILAEVPGARIAYTPNAVVHHKVEPARLSREELARRLYCSGISLAILHRRERFPRRLIGLVRRAAKLGVLSLSWLAQRLAGSDMAASHLTYQLHRERGYVKEMVLGPSGACAECPERERRMEGEGSA
jgi:glycosyltransferase involved in cell wall biosynthesis